MKTHLKRILGILLITLLILAAFPAFAVQNTAAAYEAMQAYQNVINGSSTYIQCNSLDQQYTETKFSAKISAWYGYSFNKTLQYQHFCVTDLDADGIPEIILSLSDDFGFELLRFESGKVYGFPFVYRAMEDVTLNGHLAGSNGAADNGWYSVRFSKNQYQIANNCWQSTNGDQQVYEVAGKQATKADFDACCKQIKQEKRPLWLNLNQKTLSTVVKKFQTTAK